MVAGHLIGAQWGTLHSLAKEVIGEMIAVGDTIEIGVSLQTADLITDVLIVVDGTMGSTTAESA